MSSELQQPSPLTMLAVSEQFQGVLSDQDAADRIWDATDVSARELRNALERLNRLSLQERPPDRLALQAVTAILMTRVDALIAPLNDLKLHMHEAKKNMTDFCTLVIDVELSHRKPNHPLRPRGTPLQIDVRQTALGPETIIDDDTCPTANIARLSLF